MAGPAQGDLVLYQCNDNPANDTATVGGGINFSDPITGGTVGESFQTAVENTFPGTTQYRYKKNFWYNQNVTYPAASGLLYIQNAIIPIGSAGTVSLVSNNSADSATIQCQVIGYDNGGNPNSEIIVLQGTTPVSGTITWSQICKIISQAVGTTSVLATAGNVTATVGGTVIGTIPQAYYGATAQGSIWAATTLNDTTTIPNDLTQPGAAYGTVTVTGSTITPGDILTITLESVAVHYTVLLGATLATIAAGLAAALNANGTLGPNFTASSVSNVVLIAVNPSGSYVGTAGNSVTLAVSVSGGATETLTRSGSTLANGYVVNFAPGAANSQPRNYNESNVAVANSGSLTNLSEQGVWIQQAIPPGLISSPDIEFILEIGWQI